MTTVLLLPYELSGYGLPLGSIRSQLYSCSSDTPQYLKFWALVVQVCLRKYAVRYTEIIFERKKCCLTNHTVEDWSGNKI